MKFSWIPLVLFILIVQGIYSRFTKRKPREPAKKVKAPRLNTEGLPTVQEVLADVGLAEYLPHLIKMGVTETRLLLRLSPMDFQMMLIEWDGVPAENVTKLKDAVAKLVVQATMPEEELKVDLDARNRLTYGRIYMADAVQSYEYVSASFGGVPPIGKLQLFIPDSIDGCEPEDVNYDGKLVAVQRGNCTFLEKSLIAAKNKAAVLLIVNSEDRLDRPASGYGINPNISEEVVLSLGSFPVISTSNSTWTKFLKAIDFNKGNQLSTFVDVVPLQCGTGGQCAPVTDQEKALQTEISWGTLRTRLSLTGQRESNAHTSGGEVKSFEFLTSNFGCHLPTLQPIEISLASPIDGCTELVSALDGTNAGYYKDSAVVMHRGGCRFDQKVFHAQEAGARMVIVVDVDDNALQRMGGMHPTVDFVGIPSILITAPSGQYIVDQLSGTISSEDTSTKSSSTANVSVEGEASMMLQGKARMTAEIVVGSGSKVADLWIELAFTEFMEKDDERLMQLEGMIQKYAQSESGEIVAWLRRRMDAIKNPGMKSVDTDA